MFLTDIVVVLAILLFVAAVAIELRKDRDKKMYVGGEAKTRQDRGYAESSGAPELPPDKLSGRLPVVPPEAGPPVVTQEELSQADRDGRKKSA
jgi:hypothetical protein